MPDRPNGDVIFRHPKTTLLATLTTIFETGANRIGNAEYRSLLITLVPFISLGITLLLKTL